MLLWTRTRQGPLQQANISKRQVKSPKVYIRGSGLLHSLLQIESSTDLEQHPKVGASWEGFVLEQLVTHLAVDDEQIYFWATHSGAELDVFIPREQKNIGVEIKRTTTPKVTPSIKAALHALELQEVVVIHALDRTFPLAKKVRQWRRPG